MSSKDAKFVGDSVLSEATLGAEAAHPPEEKQSEAVAGAEGGAPSEVGALSEPPRRESRNPDEVFRVCQK